MNTKKILGIIAVTLLVALAFVGAAAAEDKIVFVSDNGNDTTGDGTETLPYATIKKAIEENATTIKVKDILTVDDTSEITGLSNYTGKIIAPFESDSIIKGDFDDATNNGYLTWFLLRANFTGTYLVNKAAAFTQEPISIDIPAGTTFMTLNSDTVVSIPASSKLKISGFDLVSKNTMYIVGGTGASADLSGEVQGNLYLGIDTATTSGITVESTGKLFVGYKLSTDTLTENVGPIKIEGVELTIPAAKTLTNNGTIVNDGTIILEGGSWSDLIASTSGNLSYATLTGSGHILGDGEIDVAWNAQIINVLGQTLKGTIVLQAGAGKSGNDKVDSIVGSASLLQNVTLCVEEGAKLNFGVDQDDRAAGQPDLTGNKKHGSLIVSGTLNNTGEVRVDGTSGNSGNPCQIQNNGIINNYGRFNVGTSVYGGDTGSYPYAHYYAGSAAKFYNLGNGYVDGTNAGEVVPTTESEASIVNGVATVSSFAGVKVALDNPAVNEIVLNVNGCNLELTDNLIINKNLIIVNYSGKEGSIDFNAKITVTDGASLTFGETCGPVGVNAVTFTFNDNFELVLDGLMTDFYIYGGVLDLSSISKVANISGTGDIHIGKNFANETGMNIIAGMIKNGVTNSIWVNDSIVVSNDTNSGSDYLYSIPAGTLFRYVDEFGPELTIKIGGETIYSKDLVQAKTLIVGVPFGELCVPFKTSDLGENVKRIALLGLGADISEGFNYKGDIIEITLDSMSIGSEYIAPADFGFNGTDLSITSIIPMNFTKVTKSVTTTINAFNSITGAGTNFENINSCVGVSSLGGSVLVGTAYVDETGEIQNVVGTMLFMNLKGSATLTEFESGLVLIQPKDDTSTIEVNYIDDDGYGKLTVSTATGGIPYVVMAPVAGKSYDFSGWSALGKKTGTEDVYEINGYSGAYLIIADFDYNSVNNTYFIYQVVDNNDIPAGIYLSKDRSLKFTMPQLSGSNTYTIGKTDTVEEGQYYLNGDDSNTAIYIQRAGVSNADVSAGIKAVSEYSESQWDASSESYKEDHGYWANVTFAGNVSSSDYIIVAKKDDTGAYRTKLPSMGTGETLSSYTTKSGAYQFTTEDVGTWSLYAELLTENDYGIMDKDTPDEYRYIKLGDLKIVSSKDHGTTAVTTENLIAKNGQEFSLEITAPKGDEITIGYRSDDDADSFNLITTDKNSGNAFYLINGQENLYLGSTFVVPTSGKLIISMIPNSGLIEDKNYTLVIKNEQNVDSDGNVIDVEINVLVKGYTFTAALEKASYNLGEDVKITGSYEDTIPLYFYVEGSNIPFMNIQRQGDYVDSDYKVTENYYPYSGFKEKSSGTDWTYTIYSDLMTGGYNKDGKTDIRDIWNPGTYTIYISTVAPSSTPVKDTSGNVLYYDYKNHTYTASEKAAISAGGKVLTLTLTQPSIQITDLQKEVEKNKYIKVNIDAFGTDKISIYVIGQNKYAYINGDNTPVYSLKSSSDMYLYDWFDVASGKDKSVMNVLKRWGPTDFVDESQVDTITIEGETYSTAGTIDNLIVENTDGTYSAYIYIPESGWDYGQYYVVAQHPMADGIFNTTAYDFDEDHSYVYYNMLQFEIIRDIAENGTVLMSEAQTVIKDLMYNTFGVSSTLWPGTDFSASAVYSNIEYAIFGSDYTGATSWIDIVNDYGTYVDNLSRTSGYTSGLNVYTNGSLAFNVPAVNNKEAANKLLAAITAGNDAKDQRDFWVVPVADVTDTITGVNESYKQGETITILVTNTEDIAGATLEANTFDVNAENLNYIQSFAVEKTKNGDYYNLKLTLDTTEVPVGEYSIIIKDTSDDVVKVYSTKIVEKSNTPVVEVTVSISGATALKVGETTLLTAKNSDGSTAKFAWKSSDASVASVDDNGNVKGLKAGTVTITVTNTVTGKSASKTITVSQEVIPDTPVTPETPTSPGFGILAALAGLGAVAAVVLRRK